jgi:hypothetical protein
MKVTSSLSKLFELSKTKSLVVSSPLKILAQALSPLWVFGLALFLFLTGMYVLIDRNWIKLSGKLDYWLIFLIMGIVFPVVTLGVTFASVFSKKLEAPVQVIKVFCSGFFFAIIGYYLFTTGRYYLLVFSILQFVLLINFFQNRTGLTKTIQMAVGFAVVLISTTVCNLVLWWSPFDQRLFGTIFSFVVSCVTLLLVTSNLGHSYNVNDKTSNSQALNFATSKRNLNIIAFLIIGIVAFRSDGLFTSSPEYHWAFFTGPAELVRQGGWLLWDVPSAYGFLSILSIAAFPSVNTWQSMYIVNSLCLFVSAAFIFYLFRLLRPGMANWFMALFLAISSVFLIQGQGNGIHFIPSLGALRYLWCYLLLAILLWEFRTSSTSRMHKWTLVTGCVAWLISVFWSVETGVYSTVIWLPAYVLIIGRKVLADYSGRPLLKPLLRAMLFWLAIPIGMFVSALALIYLIYLVGLGHAPDWYAYVDHALAFTNSTGINVIDESSPGPEVWILLLVFGLLSTFAIFAVTSKQIFASTALAWGSWAAFWSTVSIYVTQNYPTRVNSLLPIGIAGIGILLYLIAYYQIEDWWVILFKLAIIPLITVIIIVGFSEQARTTLLVTGYQAGYASGNVAKLRPSIDKELSTVLAAANVKPSDNLAFCSRIYPSVMMPNWPVKINNKDELIYTTQAMLPFQPYAMLITLPNNRTKTYIERFAQRHSVGGWVIQRRPKLGELACIDQQGLSEVLPTIYVIGSRFETSNWQVIRLDTKKDLNLKESDTRFNLTNTQEWRTQNAYPLPNTTNTWYVGANAYFNNIKPLNACLSEYSYFYIKIKAINIAPDSLIRVFYLFEGQTQFSESQVFSLFYNNPQKLGEYAFPMANLKGSQPKSRLSSIRLDPVQVKAGETAQVEITDARLVRNNNIGGCN